MDRNKIDVVFVMVAGIAAFATYNIAYGLKTGEIRGRFDWVVLADDPERFQHAVGIHALSVAALIAFLWLLHFRRRK